MLEDEDPRSNGRGAIGGIAANPGVDNSGVGNSGASSRSSIAPRSTGPGSKPPKSAAQPRSKFSWSLALLAYVVLVGMPLAALVAVIRFGANLSAPPSVSGTWAITETTVTKASSLNCVSLSPGEKLSIEQSGRYLRVAASNGALATGDAVLEGKQIVGQLRSTRKGCPQAAFRLEAQLAASNAEIVPQGDREMSAPDASPDAGPSGKTEGLIARLEAVDCADCAALTFRAERWR